MSARQANLQHFASHISEVEPYAGEGGYRARRLVHFGSGLVTAGICGYVHAAGLYLAPRAKLLPHWHQDREAIFYCLEGDGSFLLDGLERAVGPGDAMFIPLGALHGGRNRGGNEFRFLDCALFTGIRSPLPVGDACFARLADAPETSARGAVWKAPFARDTFGNTAILWWGELLVGPGRALERGIDAEAEQILYVLEGSGRLSLWDQEIEVRPGSIVYILPGVPHGVATMGEERLRMVGSRSRIGRVGMPEYYRVLTGQDAQR